ncbi:2-succinyl-6-hydroxy-2,4-cyclohexadiene-1-carboxylate synthase [Rhodococcus sp. T7]|nr:2-succinyl-6-hydroxy-2,4-cyclohexadiene-1-carboxylate synthase [Rhodococcus sp. T7]
MGGDFRRSGRCSDGGAARAGARRCAGGGAAHGLGATSTLMLPVLATLAPHHRVLAPDLSGFGSSAAPSWDYDPAQLQRWLRAFLDTGGAPTAAAIGHSLGGRVALELALRPPDTARSLVLLCPAPAAGRQRPRTTLPRRLPADLTRLPIAFPHRLLHEGTRGAHHTLTADPGQVPRHWFDAAADEWEIALQRPGHRRALWSATLASISAHRPATRGSGPPAAAGGANPVRVGRRRHRGPRPPVPAGSPPPSRRCGP